MWTELDGLRGSAETRQISALFEADVARAKNYCLKTDGLLFDYSKTSIDAEAKAALIRLRMRQVLRQSARRCLPGKKSTKPKIARFCIQRCGLLVTNRLLSMAKTYCLR